jgi:hypothetical protein
MRHYHIRAVEFEEDKIKYSFRPIILISNIMYLDSGGATLWLCSQLTTQFFNNIS